MYSNLLLHEVRFDPHLISILIKVVRESKEFSMPQLSNYEINLCNITEDTVKKIINIINKLKISYHIITQNDYIKITTTGANLLLIIKIFKEYKYVNKELIQKAKTDFTTFLRLFNDVITNYKHDKTNDNNILIELNKYYKDINFYNNQLIYYFHERYRKMIKITQQQDEDKYKQTTQQQDEDEYKQTTQQQDEDEYKQTTQQQDEDEYKQTIQQQDEDEILMSKEKIKKIIENNISPNFFSQVLIVLKGLTYDSIKTITQEIRTSIKNKEKIAKMIINVYDALSTKVKKLQHQYPKAFLVSVLLILAALITIVIILIKIKKYKSKQAEVKALAILKNNEIGKTLKQIK